MNSLNDYSCILAFLESEWLKLSAISSGAGSNWQCFQLFMFEFVIKLETLMHI